MTAAEAASWMNGWDAARARAGRAAPLLAPSVMCADWLHMGDEIRRMERGGADVLHFDIVDGHFAPNFIIGLDLIRAARRASGLPFEAHLMVCEPGPLLERFSEAGVQLTCIHAEACADPLAVVQRIRALGMRAGVALSPDVPADSLRPMLGLVDEVLVMTIVPGVGGQSLIPETLPRVGEVRSLLGAQAESVLIAVDGQVSRQTAPGLVRQGARLLVCGRSSVFGHAGDAEHGLRAFRADLARLLRADEPE